MRFRFTNTIRANIKIATNRAFPPHPKNFFFTSNSNNITTLPSFIFPNIQIKRSPSQVVQPSHKLCKPKQTMRMNAILADINSRLAINTKIMHFIEQIITNRALFPR